MSTFLMPSLGADMEAGTLVEWLVAPGDKIARGDIVAVVETEKGAIEVEIFEDGKVGDLLVTPGTTVPVGTPLAVMVKPGETPTLTTAVPEPETAQGPKAEVPIIPPTIFSNKPPTPSPESSGTRLRASPAARRLAREKVVDLSGLTGTGPGGAIISSDLILSAKNQSKPEAVGIDLGAMRKAIAAAMARSKKEIPHYYLQHTIDMTACLNWLDEANAQRSPADRLLAAALYVKAIARALSKYSEFNGHFMSNAFAPSEAIHTGFAIALRGGGLVAPGIHDADRLSLDELMAKMKDLVIRARRGRLRSSEIADPTITISSLGERGVGSLFGIIYPPQVAIVGFGKIERRPSVIDDQVVPRDQVTITLSADHRVSDGHRGALFLAEIGKGLQMPEEL